jgi:hypothetical protein
MVCSKCQKALQKTELATPGVKRKNEMYLGSPTAGEKSRASTNGISKVCYPHQTRSERVEVLRFAIRAKEDQLKKCDWRSG